MRKIKRPNITVKAREVFYRLKRSRQLEDLTEETIEEILGQRDLKSLLDLGCVYGSFERAEIEAASQGTAVPVGATLSLGVATLGDRGFEAHMKNLSGDSHKVAMTWAQAMLDKLVDFSAALIKEEAVQENLEAGPAIAVSMDKETALAGFIWERLNPAEKIQAQLISDPLNGSLKTTPAFTRAWVTSWLTKKEKKQLAAA